MSEPAPRNYRIGKSYRGLFEGTHKDPFILVESRRGCGKTASILKCLCVRAFQYPGSKYIIARSTRKRLSESVIDTFDTHVLPSFGLSAPTTDPSHRTGYDFPNGSRFIFMALDDASRSQSVEADGAYISEAVELSTMQEATALVGAIRQRMDAIQVGEVPPEDKFKGLVRQVILDANPGAPGHWVNQKAEPAGDELRQINTREDYERTVAFNNAPSKGGWKRIIASMPDNPGYWDRDLWKPTEVCQRYLDGLGEMLPYMRQRWLHGLWVAAEGAVFAGSFLNSRNVIPSFKPPRSWPCRVYIDFGVQHPTACGWFVVTPTGKRICVAEIHQSGLDGVQELAKLIREKNKALGIEPMEYYGDPRHAFSTTFQSTVTIAGQFEKEGFLLQPYGRFQGAGVQASVDQVAEALRTGQLMFTEDCVGIIGDMQTWAYKKTSSGDLPAGDDAYEDRHNDGVDIVRGHEAAQHEPPRKVVFTREDEQRAVTEMIQQFEQGQAPQYGQLHDDSPLPGSG